MPNSANRMLRSVCLPAMLSSLLSLAIGNAHAIVLNNPDPCAPPGEQLLQGANPADCDTKETPVGVSQPGVTNSMLNGMATSMGSTIGGVVGGAFGGTGGASLGAAGVARYALGGQTGQAAAAGAARWNLWAAYTFLDIGYGFQPLQSGGHSNLALGGIDYMISNSLLAGVAVTDERTRIDTSYNGGRISGDGNTVAPYLGWRINRDWTLDASLGFGDTRMTSIDNSVAGGITGSNKARRSMGTLGLAYSTVSGRWLLTGKGSLLAVENRMSAFTLSNGTPVAESAARTAQLRLGGQAAYNAGLLVPFVGLTYIYDIQHSAQAAVGGLSAANDRDGWQLRAGLNMRSAGALYGGIVLSSEVGRSQVKNDQLLVNIGVRF
jgi:hypothetical protein